jgi:uncharacterized protein (TIGR03435 family)
MNTCLASVIVLSTIGAFAAQNAPDQPKFEVASVKRTDRCEFNTSLDPGAIVLKGVPLKAVLREAFKVPLDQIEGPSWLDSDCFEISAKMPEGATRDQLPAMLEALLIERFKLVVHKEGRLRPGYALVVDKDGPKLKESDPSSNFMGTHAGQLFIGAAPGYSALKASMTTASFAHHLSVMLKCQVQDLTGLKGKYDIDVAWVPDRSFEPLAGSAADWAVAHPGEAEPPSSLPNAPTTDIFTAIRESLGLKLEPRKQQVEVLVIDHIERVPTAN